MLLAGIIKVLKPINKSIQLKIKPNKKILTLSVSYQYAVNKVLTIWAKLPKYIKILDLLFSLTLYFWEELFKFSNLQIIAFGWKLGQTKSY